MLVVCAAAAVLPAAQAQKWEFGGGAGGGFYTSQDVTVSGSSASATIQTNVAGSAWLANSIGPRWGGEIRYDYQLGDLALSQGGTKATFGADTQAIHYDFLWHTAPPSAKVRPFLAAGAGVKIYRGTGTEVVYQPLQNYALLTKAQDLTALVSVGAGVKWQLTPKVLLRLEVHDYMTTFPKQVITPNTGAKVGNWIQDIVPMVGLSYLF